MRKVLFLLNLVLIFAVSCGESKSTEKNPVNEGNMYESSDSDSNPTNPGDLADTHEDTDHADSGQPSDQAEPTTDPADPTEHADPSEEPDSDKNPDEFQEPEEPVAEKFCQQACETASDCVQVTSNAVYDEDNYKCENHKCVYLGCLSDDECDEVYANVTNATGRVYRCNKNGAYGYPECTPICSSAADCNLYGEGSTQYAYDLDNNKCENGFCVFTGCLSDAECETMMSSSNYKCLPQEYAGKILKICTLSCKTAADCANSVYPEDFYECRNSQCVTKSCESDEWCAEYMTDDYSCM